MPDYTIRDPATGRTVRLRGDSPPTERELEEIFASVPAGEASPSDDSRSLGARAYDAAFTRPEVVRRGAERVSAAIEGVARPEQTGGIVDAIRAIPDVARGLVSHPIATIRGGAAGAVEGASQLVTPGDVALTAMQLRGAKAPLRAAMTAVNAATVARGVERAVKADTGSDRAAGAFQAAMGGIGFAGQRRAGAPARAAAARSTGTQARVEAIRKIAPPTTRYRYDADDVVNALPFVEDATGGKVRTAKDLAAGLAAGVKRIEAAVSTAVEAYPDDVLRMPPVADTVRRSLEGHVDADFLPSAVKALRSLDLDGPVTLKRADELRRYLRMSNDSAKAASALSHGQAMQTDPAYAARALAADALSEGIYTRLADRGASGVAELRKLEGSLLRVRRVADRAAVRGDAVVPGTASRSPSRAIAAGLTRAAGAGVGGAMGGGFGAIAGLGVGDDIARRFVVASPLTRDQVVAKAFRGPRVTTSPTLPSVASRPSVRGALEAPAVRLGPAADASYVRSVPAVYPDRVARPNQRLLMAGPKPAIALGPAADASYVRSVPAVYPEKIEGWRPPAVKGANDVNIPGESVGSVGSGQPIARPGALVAGGAENSAAFAGLDEYATPDIIRAAFEADATASGYRGTPDDFREAFGARLADAQELIDDLASSHRPTKLFEDIAALGGLGDDAGRRGELRQFWENLDVRSRRGRLSMTPGKGKRHEVRDGSLAGVRGVRRPTGLTLDSMAEALRELDPVAYGDIDGPNTLLDALHATLDSARRKPRQAPSLLKALEAIGVRPGSRWWDGMDDLSFDAASFDIQAGRKR